MEELSAFLNSPEALKLPSKDLLFLKLLESEALGMTTIFTPEQRILSIGDIPSTAYLITSGEASQSSKNTGFCTLGPGSIIGLAEGFSDEPGQTSVIARTPIVARVIPINKATQAVRSSNKGLIGIARFTTMRILESEDPPSVFQ
jgi:CRP-like cAMP-binding protein